MKKARTAQLATVIAALAIMAALLAYPSVISLVSANASTNGSIQSLAATTTTTSASTTGTNSTTSTTTSVPSSTQSSITSTQSTTTSSSATPQTRDQQGDHQGNLGPSPHARGDGRYQYQSPVNFTVGQTITITSSSGDYLVLGTLSTNGTASGTLTFTVTSKLSAGYTLSLTSGNIVIVGTTYTVSSGSAQMGPFADALSGQGTTTPTGQFLLRAQARGSFAGTSGSVLLDFTNGTTEYAVVLTGTITG